MAVTKSELTVWGSSARVWAGIIGSICTGKIAHLRLICLLDRAILHWSDT